MGETEEPWAYCLTLCHIYYTGVKRKKKIETKVRNTFLTKDKLGVWKSINAGITRQTKKYECEGTPYNAIIFCACTRRQLRVA